MKSMYPFFLLSLLTIHTHAQVGIGTVSPSSVLDTRGSFSAISRTFSYNGAASIYFMGDLPSGIRPVNVLGHWLNKS